MTTFLHRIAILVLIFLPVSEVSAQLQSSNRFGVYGGYNLNFHTAGFRELPGAPNCCPNFEKGSGGGVAVGALFEIAISQKFWVTVRGGYSGLNATLIRQEFVPAIRLSDGHYFEEAAIEHRIKAKLSTIGIEPLITFNPIGRLRFHTGLGFSSLSTINYDQVEEITAEGLVFKENLQRTRNEFSGQVANTNKIQTSLVFGTSIELPLNKNRSMLIVPEAMFHVGLSNLSQDVSWRANSFRIGLALKYAPQSAPLPAKENPAVPSDTLPKVALSTHPSSISKEISKRETSAAHFEIYGVTDKGEQFPIQEIRVEEFISTQLKPILPYIFFDANSSAIPERYTTIAPSDRSLFSLHQTGHSSTIEFYHQILNIVGKRMIDNPDAVLKLTGYNTDTEDEKGQKIFSIKRAEKVRDYLISVWNIPSSRIKIDNRNLPVNVVPTSETDIAALEAEKRHVEISSDNQAILAPVMSRDTIRSVSPSVIRIKTDYKQWSTNIKSEGKILTTVASVASNYCDWHPTDYGTKIGESVILTGGGEATGLERAIPVEFYSLNRKQNEQRSDKTIDKYSLILFDFDRSDLSAQNKSIAEFVKSTLTPGAKVSIAGTTDQMGDAGYNRKLSLDRARATAAALGTMSAVLSGDGESETYPNTLPEGRFYNRTVVITVETPK